MTSSAPDSGVRRVLIVGHGTAGRALADDVVAHGGIVVGFLDDSVDSPEVLGRLDDVDRVLVETGADTIYFAIPSIQASAFRRFVASIKSDSVRFAMVPRTYRTLASETVSIGDLTDVDVLDLVGREPVKQDLQSSLEFVRGRTILVTGAAGSIGSRLVEHLIELEPARVIGLDWWENGVFFLEQRVTSDLLELRIGDARDPATMRRLFEEVRPDVVFHAAAYKHVPLMQRSPAQAILNNVGSTRLIVDLSREHGVDHLVYVSTDKAVNPVNVMGATKRLGELIVGAAAASESGPRCNVVRFGNVIESNGSVMQIFRSQIAEGRALTVTHEDITRFFMTVDEATLLVIQSAFVASPGDTLVLDMGEPVRILDLAQALVRAVDPTLEIRITGLRPGEKMFEELSYEPDGVMPTANPKIFAMRDRSDLASDELLTRVDALLERAARHECAADELIDDLRSFGFAIQ